MKTCCEATCEKPARKKGMCSTHYNKAHGYYFPADLVKDPVRERARQRIITHRRKDWSRLTDITPEYEIALRAKAKCCPLCGRKLIDQPYLPASKELDHIIPRSAGGTHTIGNVRILCRQCNGGRPKDGSDYVGPVTLWAEQAAAVVPRRRYPKQLPFPCQICGEPRRGGHRCPWQTPSPAGSGDEGQRSYDLRAAGMTWQLIADQLGWNNAASPWTAARTYAVSCDLPWPPLGAVDHRPNHLRRTRSDRLVSL